MSPAVFVRLSIWPLSLLSLAEREMSTGQSAVSSAAGEYGQGSRIKLVSGR